MLPGYHPMQVAFEQNRLKPGDEGYTHDKRVEFKARQIDR